MAVAGLGVAASPLCLPVSSTALTRPEGAFPYTFDLCDMLEELRQSLG